MRNSVLWRDNWHLLSLLGVMLIILGVGMLRSLGSDNTGEAQVQAQHATTRDSGGGSTQPRPHHERLQEILEREPGPFPPDEATRTEDLIETYQAAFDADPDDPDAPRYLLAIANLYLYRLENPEEARIYYELLLYNYEVWGRNASVYDGLWKCYESLEDYNSVIHLAQLIQERHPDEDSEEHRLAQEMLGASLEEEEDDDENSALDGFGTAGQ